MMMKYSRQREMILRYLSEKKNHPTAEQIYADLKPEAPALSLATVYRNLNLLCSLGEVRRLDTGENVDRFDADTSPHAHFICQHCQAVTDLFADLVDEKKAKKLLGDDFSVEKCSVFLYGLCPCCKQLTQ